MSLDKAIEHGKEHRKAYRGAKAINKQCRNHGTCAYCRNNRLHKSNKLKEEKEWEMKVQTNQKLLIKMKD